VKINLSFVYVYKMSMFSNLNDVGLGPEYPNSSSTTALQQGKAYSDYTADYTNMVLPSVALMGGDLSTGTDYASVSEQLSSEIIIEIETDPDSDIKGDNASQNVSGKNKNRQNIASTSLSNSQGLKSNNSQHRDQTQEQKYQQIEDEYQRLLSEYNREYKITMELSLKNADQNKKPSPDLQNKMKRVAMLEKQLNKLALQLEDKTHKLTQVEKKIKDRMTKSKSDVKTSLDQHNKINKKANKKGLSSDEMSTAQGQMEDASLMLTSHYYHYLMWIIVAITLISLATHVLVADNNNPINILVMIIILIAFFFVLRAVYHYYSTHSLILR
jgi:hypothetical protein